MEEIWKDIEGYEGLYQVSNMGRVRSLERTRSMNQDRVRKPVPVPGRILVPQKKKAGYLGVVLSKDGKQRNVRIHCIVAKSFLPNPEGKPQVNHINGIKSDNRLSNLEWATNSENQQHALATGLRDMSQRRKAIFQYDMSGKFIRSWNGAVEVEKETGMSQRYVASCCRGEERSAYGFVWKYESEVMLSDL